MSVLLRMLPLQTTLLDQDIVAWSKRMNHLRINNQFGAQRYMPQCEDLIFLNNLARFIKEDRDAFEPLAIQMMDAYDSKDWTTLNSVTDQVRMLAKLKGLIFHPDYPINPVV